MVQRPEGARPRTERLALLAALAVSSCATLDLLAGPEPVPLRAALFTASLGFGLGALLGAAVGVAFGRLRWVSRGVRVGCWLAAGLLTTWWLVTELGALGRLGGPYHRLAVTAMGASAVCGAFVAALGLTLQPTRRHGAGWLGSRGESGRMMAVIALGLVASAAYWLDRNVEPDQYRPAHLALRWALLGSLAAILHLGLPPLDRRRWLRRGLPIAAAVAVAAPALTMERDDYVALDAMLSRPLPALVLASGRSATDVDRDGHAAWLGGADCAPFDGAIHPGAREQPDNGIDDNCRLGDAPRPESGRLPARAEPLADAATSIVLITIDAVCARRTSLYGARRNTTPRLAEWAKGALTFERAYSTGGWTSLALPSLFYGRYPRRLRYTRVLETSLGRLLPLAPSPELVFGERPLRQFGLVLNEPRQPLWRLLRRRGMTVVAVVDDGDSAFLSSEIGAFDGFDRYVEADTLPTDHGGDRAVREAATAELEALARGRPFLLWVHFYGPHKPSTRHPEVPWYGDGLEERYDHELRFADEQVGRLLSAIEQVRRRRPVAVIIASDHGESFGRRSRGHGWNLEEDAIRIPLLLDLPAGPAGRVPRLVSLVDIAPTILALTGTPAPPEMDGIPLMAEPDERNDRRVLFAETWHDTAYGEKKRDLVAAFDGRHKLVADFITGARRLTTQADGGGNLLDRIDASHLLGALDRFMERN